MAKKNAGTEAPSVRTLGEWIGQAIGEGIAAGAQKSLGPQDSAFAPLVDEIVNSLRQQLIAAHAAQLEALVAHDFEQPDELAEVARTEALRPCIEDGCGEEAISRNLCRKHYARKLYQERKERLGAHGFRVVQPRTLGTIGGEQVAQKKPLVAAVAPIVRRKRTDGIDAPAPAAEVAQPAFKIPAFEVVPNPIAAAAARNGVTPESVARALGLVKE